METLPMYYNNIDIVPNNFFLFTDLKAKTGYRRRKYNVCTYLTI